MEINWILIAEIYTAISLVYMLIIISYRRNEHGKEMDDYSFTDFLFLVVISLCWSVLLIWEVSSKFFPAMWKSLTKSRARPRFPDISEYRIKNKN